MIFCVDNEIGAEFDFDLEAVGLSVACQTLAKAAASDEEARQDILINLLITGDEDIRQLNLVHRGIDAPTDVLSFPAFTFAQPGGFYDLRETMQEERDPGTGAVWFGDIVISADRLKKQAEDYAHSQKREYAFLVAHSILHLLGFDHEEEADAVRMEALQEQILTALGITRG